MANSMARLRLFSRFDVPLGGRQSDSVAPTDLFRRSSRRSNAIKVHVSSLADSTCFPRDMRWRRYGSHTDYRWRGHHGHCLRSKSGEPADTEYLVDSHIVITAGATLTIRREPPVRFESGVGLKVGANESEGSLVAVGMPSLPVIFTARERNARGLAGNRVS